jgi:hypothetical protein
MSGFNDGFAQFIGIGNGCFQQEAFERGDIGVSKEGYEDKQDKTCGYGQF